MFIYMMKGVVNFALSIVITMVHYKAIQHQRFLLEKGVMSMYMTKEGVKNLQFTQDRVQK